MKNVVNLILELASQDININLEDGKLKVNSPEGILNDSVIEKIKSQKKELIEYLSGVDDKITIEIPRTEKPGPFAVSASQKRLWILSQSQAGSAAYNMPGVYLFTGKLNKDALERCFKTLFDRHEILRTVFKENGEGEIFQFVKPAAETDFVIPVTDLRRDTNRNALAKSAVANSFAAPFDLETGPLLRVSLLRIEDHKWVFCYVMHHIISDGWSMGVLLEEMLVLYNSFTRNEVNPLIPLRIQYKDYSEWQREELSGEKLGIHKEYWLNNLAGQLPVLELPSDKVRPAFKTYNGASIKYELNEAISKGLRSLSRQYGGTLFMGLLTSLNALMYRYTGQEDIIIGSSLASRDHADLVRQIGFYVNTVAFRTRFSKSDSFKDLFEKVKQTTLGAYEHQLYPFDELVDNLKLQRNAGKSPLFDMMLVLQNDRNSNTGDDKTKNNKFGELQVDEYEDIDHVVSKFEITFFVFEVGEKLYLNLVYNTDIFSGTSMNGLIKHFEQLLKSFIENPLMPISEQDYLGIEEKNQLLRGFNTSTNTYDENKTIVSLFEEQVIKTPDAIAVQCANQQLTYKELNEKSNQVANYLVNTLKVKVGDPVAFMLERSENLIISILGILKSGGVYIPIDPAYPKLWKERILKDAGVETLITQTDFIFDLEYFQKTVFAIDIQLSDINTSIKPPQINNKPDDLAYIIYTSGSTGIPKGVMISHGSVVDYYYGIMSKTNIADCKTFGFVSTIAADLGNTVLFPSILTGGTLCIFSREDVMDPEKMYNSGVDCMKIVPSHWKALQVEDRVFLPHKCLIFGGEQLTADVIDKVKLGNYTCQVYNHYGPSETTVGKLLKRIDLNATNTKIPLGSPFGNTSVYVLDEQCSLVPVGVIGEICLSGKGLAKGYLNSHELTETKFINNPFNKAEKMYKTGDLGKWLSSGEIEFIGRKDDQVKIRGYRIELGEIESALKSVPSVEESVVLAKLNAEGDKFLVAYIVSKTELDHEDIKASLGNVLPAHMIPSFIVQIERIPITANGKIDRKALPEPEEINSLLGEKYRGPENDTERRVVALWEEVLKKERISIDDDFFSLGGDSIKAVQLSWALGKHKMKINVADLFSYPSVSKLSAFIMLNSNGSNEDVEHNWQESIPQFVKEVIPFKVDDVYPVSAMQRIMIEEYEKDHSNGIYHSLARFVLKDESFSADSLSEAIKLLQEKHPVLRTVFFTVKNNIYQCVKSEIGNTLEIEDISALNKNEQKIHLDKKAAYDIKNKFKINNWEEFWVRFKIYILSESTVEFMMSTHHSIVDGWGHTVFYNELIEYYLAIKNNQTIPSVRPSGSFKEHVYACERVSESANAIDFWWNELKEWKPFQLEKKSITNDAGTYGQSKILALDTTLVKQLRAFAVEQKVSLRAIFLSCLLKAMQSVFKNEDITLEVVFNGRTKELTDPFNSMGLFWNMLPFSVSSQKNASIKEVHEKLNKCEEFARFSGWKIKEKIGTDPAYACFNYVHFHNAKNWTEEKNTGAGHNLEFIEGSGFERYHYPLNFHAAVNPHNEDEITIRGEFNGVFFTNKEMENILNQYKVQLEKQII